MIFVTLGSQKFQFNRLLKAIDDLMEKDTFQGEVFAQTGYSDYKPKNYKYKSFLNRDDFSKRMNEAELVISHGGTGAIISALKKRKKVIAVPRLMEYGEHVDNHQLQLVEQFSSQNFICKVEDCKEIENAIAYCKEHTFNTYKSNTAAFINSIDDYLKELR